MQNFLDERPPEESTFNSFLRFLGRPGWAVRDVLDGNFQGAARQGLDTFGDIIDSALPGDLIPEFSRKQDFTEASDLVGGMEDGWAKTATDIVGGIALDPLTYLSFGAAPAANAAAKGLRVADTLSDTARAGAKVSELGAHLSKAGRSALKESPNFLDDIVRDSGSVDDILSTIGKSDKFNQGGMRFRVPFTDIGTDTFFAGKNLDPLSNIGTQLGKIPGAKEAGTFARDLFGMDNASVAGSSLLNEGQAVAKGTQKAAQAYLEKNLAGYTPAAREALLKAFHGVDKTEDVWAPLTHTTPMQSFEDFSTQSARLQEHLAQTGKALDPEEFARLSESGNNLLQFNMDSYNTAVKGGGFAKGRMFTNEAGERIQLDDLLQEIDNAKRALKGESGDLTKAVKEIGQLRKMGMLGDEAALSADDMTLRLDEIAERLKAGKSKKLDRASWIEDLGYDLKDVPDNVSPSMYLHRIINGMEDVDSNILAKRAIDGPDQLASYLNEGKGTLDLDLSKAVSEQARQQGSLMGRAHVGRQILGESYVHASEDSRKLLDGMMGQIETIDPDFISQVKNFMGGMGPRNSAMELLNKANRYFKPAAVYGAVLPKFGSIIRNKMGMAWQAASVDATRSGTMGQIKSSVPDLIDAVSEAYFDVPKSTMGRARHVIEDAFAQSNGQLDDVIRNLSTKDPLLAEAAQHGILDGFVRSEDLVHEINKIDTPSQLKKYWQKAYDGPGVMFNTIESNGRLGMFLHLRSQGVSAANAAKSVGEAFLDYSIKSKNNRSLRDLIPFASFLTGSVRQQAKLVSRSPGVGVAANQVFGQDDDAPVYPWLSEQAHMRLPWDDNDGNPYYAAGFGLPIEALNSIPNLTGGNAGEEIKRTVIGSSSPLLKTAYSFVSGKDPYFDSDYGSYKKDPLTHQESELGGYYNQLAGTGLIQPVDSLLRTVGKFTDDRKGFGTAMLDSLTGVKVQSVDKKKALRQILREYLDNNSDVGEFSGFYAKDGDAELKDLIRMFSKLKN